MTNNIAVNTCIGIVFVILLYSLLATILQEIVARWFGLRGRLLQKAIRRMLEDEPQNTRFTLFNFFAEMWQDISRFFGPFSKDSFSKAFFNDTTVKGLAENSWNSKPSYLSAADFSQTVIRLLKAGSMNGNLNPAGTIQSNLHNNSFTGFKISPSTGLYLKNLMTESNGDINRFTSMLEDWFENVMSRSVGWYKRQTQLILFVIGLCIAGTFNADLIAIAKIIANNDHARDALVNMAVADRNRDATLINTLNDKSAPGTDSATKAIVIRTAAKSDSVMSNAYKMVNEDIGRVNEILGLGRKKVCRIDSGQVAVVDRLKDSLCRSNKLTVKEIHRLDSLYAVNTKCSIEESPYQQGRWKIWGWLLMAISISLGAPFWFDLLNKIMLVRSSGQKPADNEKSKTRTDQPPVKPVG